jgi:hypothetical protein
LQDYHELTASSTPAYKSAFTEQEERQKRTAIGRRIVTMAAHDVLNRRSFLEVPVCGVDLRKAVKIHLLMEDL